MLHLNSCPLRSPTRSPLTLHSAPRLRPRLAQSNLTRCLHGSSPARHDSWSASPVCKARQGSSSRPEPQSPCFQPLPDHRKKHGRCKVCLHGSACGTCLTDGGAQMGSYECTGNRRHQGHWLCGQPGRSQGDAKSCHAHVSCHLLHGAMA